METVSSYFEYDKKVRIHYRMGGSGPLTLLFLHGFAASHATWDDLVPLLPKERYRIFLLDMKGFGLSSKPRDGAYSIEEQARILCAFMAHQGLARVTLVGHSMGGGVALRALLQMMEEKKPYAVERLVLMDCAAYPQRLPKFFRKLKTPLLGPLFIRIIPAGIMVRKTMEKIFVDRSVVTPELFQRYLRYFRGRGLAYTMRASVKCIHPDRYERIGEEYGKIDVPVLIIWGERDYIIKPKLGLKLHEELPGSRLEIIEGCGHNPHEERPRETCALMADFFSDSQVTGKNSP